MNLMAKNSSTSANFVPNLETIRAGSSVKFEALVKFYFEKSRN